MVEFAVWKLQFHNVFLISTVVKFHSLRFQKTLKIHNPMLRSKFYLARSRINKSQFLVKHNRFGVISVWWCFYSNFLPKIKFDSDNLKFPKFFNDCAVFRPVIYWSLKYHTDVQRIRGYVYLTPSASDVIIQGP